MTDTTGETLRPCRGCDSDHAKMQHWAMENLYSVVCSICGCHGPQHADPKVAAHKWNTIMARGEDKPAVSEGLSVWFGEMPESNGKRNWTAILCRGNNLFEGLTFDRSEYKDRVRYEADRLRFLIGEITTEPSILDYDADLHSGYVESNPSHQNAVRALEWMRDRDNENGSLPPAYRKKIDDALAGEETEEAVDAPVGESLEEWRLETRAFQWANTMSLPEDARETIKELWRQYCAAKRATADVIERPTKPPFCGCNHDAPGDICMFHKGELSRVRDEVIEECAKVADDWRRSDYDESANTMAEHIASDIRAILVDPNLKRCECGHKLGIHSGIPPHECLGSGGSCRCHGFVVTSTHGEGKWWRHKVRGTTYTEICRSELQTAAPISEGTIIVTYRGEDGKPWSRPEPEFEDGRFEPVHLPRIEEGKTK